MALTDKLAAIGNAIRAKTGGTAKLTLDAMVTEIGKLCLLSASTAGTAAAAHILSGYTAWVAGAKITGTMANKSGTTQSATASLDTTNKRVQLTLPAAGYYTTSSKVYTAYSTLASLIGLTAAKIVSGNTILGIAGTGSAGNGATGYFTSLYNDTITINVGFKPKVVMLSYMYSGTDFTRIVFNTSNTATYDCWYGTAHYPERANGSTEIFGYLTVTSTGFTFRGYYSNSGQRQVHYCCY